MAQLLNDNSQVSYPGDAERGFNGFGVTLIAHTQMPRLRISGTVPPLRHMPS